MVRFDWTHEEIKEIYNTPLLDLVFRAAQVHRNYFPANQVQVSSLLSIKTGGCSEDCSYCPQAARYQTGVERRNLMDVEEVLAWGRSAKAGGASRLCLGAAWRGVKEGKQFDQVVEMVKGLSEMGVEVCCTLGLLNESQATRLKEAGLYAYNHNIDTSPEHYDKVISTRDFEDRLNTISHVRKAGLSVCCGGILGLGESEQDRIGMLLTLARMQPHPESVPINTLVATKGTPLADNPEVSILEHVRMIATARIVLPASFIRLSAGRSGRSVAEQALCFLAGANSIHSGEKLLTTANPQFEEDRNMFEALGLIPMPRHPKEQD